MTDDTPIRSVKELAAELGCLGETIESVSRTIYKGTDCGAWVESRGNGIAIGSIVEGVDIVTDVQELCYPFTLKEFWDAVETVEAECRTIWNDTHGCEDCGPEDAMTGYRAINPDCPSCNGEGEIL